MTPVLLLISLVFLLYLPFLGNAFVSDDIPAIVESMGKQTLALWDQPSLIHANWLMQKATHMVFGATAWPYRLENILLHVGSVVLFWAIVKRLVSGRVALVAGMFFAVHPIFIESVTWISGGVYAMYGFFFLLSFWLYVRAQESQANRLYLYALSFASFLVSVVTSEKAISLVGVYIAYEWFFGKWKRNWKQLIPYCIVSIILILFYGMQIGSRVTESALLSYQGEGGMYNPLIQVPVAISEYLRLLVWPVDLTLYHSEFSLSLMNFVLRVVVTLGYVIMLLYTVFKRKRIGFWVWWFLIALLPTLTPFKINWIVAERYGYLAYGGILVVVALGFDALLSRKRLYVPVIILGLIVLVALCTQTGIRNAEWRSEDTLWIATARTSPSHQATWNNLGDVYARQKNYLTAISMFERAIAINPQYADAYHNMAVSYTHLGNFPEAIRAYEKALSINPRLWQAYQNLAVIAMQEKQWDKAVEYVNQARSIAPDEQALVKLQLLIDSNRKQ